MLNEILTPREASDRLSISITSLHRKLSRLKDTDVLHQLIEEGKVKYILKGTT